MPKRLASLPQRLDGAAFTTDDGRRFQVVQGQFFATSNHSEPHNAYLDTLRPGLLVSVPYHGHPVPLITVDGGVVRLASVEVEGAREKGARRISTLLGVVDPKQPMGLYRA